MPDVATVTDCLERARECVEKAEALEGDEKIQMLAVASAWLKVAEEVAKQAMRPKGEKG